VRRSVLQNSAKYQRTPQSVPHGNKRRALAEAFLRAVAAGDDASVPLAIALADAVLEATGAKLAQAVLDAGPLTVTRAIRLAEVVLTAHAAGGKVGAL
jgi:hypothetical protein